MKSISSSKDVSLKYQVFQYHIYLTCSLLIRRQKMMLLLGIFGLFLTKGTNAANVAIPASGSPCTSAITFPIEV